MKKRIQFQQVLALICAISMLLPTCSALGLQFNLSADEVENGKDKKIETVEVIESNEPTQPAVFASQENQTAQNLNYCVNDDGISCTITGLVDETVTDVTIPSTIDGYTVTSIGDMAFEYCASLKSITIPDSVMSSGNHVFYDCVSLSKVYYTGDIESWLNISFSQDGNPCCGGAELYFNSELATEVEIPDTITKIGEYAFDGCLGITSITIPNSVTSIGSYAFEGGCFKTVYYEGDIESWLNISFSDSTSNPCCSGTALYFNGTLVTKVEIPDTVTKIGDYAFYNCTRLTSITIGNGVTSISRNAFYNCTSLENIIVASENGVYHSSGNSLIKTANKELVLGFNNSVIPTDGSVTSIGDEAFFGCTGLESIAIPDGVTRIGDEAFFGCTGLESIAIPDGVTRIGDEAFFGCTGLESITIPDGVTSIGDEAFFGCTNLTSITIPDSATVLGGGAFYNCSSLTNVVIGTGIKEIKTYYDEYYTYGVFEDCRSLESIIIPDSVTSIGEYAFSGCESLTSVIIGDGVTSIGGAAFECCTSLTSIIIPDSVTSIGESAFGGCSSLVSITIPDSVTSIEFGTFYGCTSLTDITIPDSVTSIGESAFGGCSSLVSITIPDSVTSIEFGTFYGCTSLTDITIPDSVTDIGNNAFYNTAYYNNDTNWIDGVLYIGNHLIKAKTSISGAYTIKDGTKCIANEAFEGCTNLISITVPDSVASIGSYAFAYCKSLASITIPDSVTNFGDGTFYWCKRLTSINIPGSVTSIGYEAFSSCTSLNKVYYNDTAEDWSEISIDSFNWELTTATRYYYSETEPTEKGYFWHYVDGKPKAWKMTEFSYSVNDDNETCTITGLVLNTDDELVIPSTIDGYFVTSIVGYAFSGCTSLTSITIGNGVTSIDQNAFSGCTSLTSITFGNGVTGIGSDAFRGCTSLTSIDIPDGVTSIGSDAFRGCTSLTSIDIPDSVTSIGSDAFYNTAYYNNDANWTDGVLYIEKYLIAAKNSILGAYTIKNGTKCIARDAFYGCKSLTSIDIPDSVTSIGYRVFVGCTNLTSVTIPDSVTSIGWYAFSDCTSLTSITIPDSVTSIGSGVFYNCKSLTSVTISNSLTSIGSRAFDNTAYYSNDANWTGGVLYIGNHLIKASISGAYTIKDGTKCIAAEAFYKCTSLTSITIPDSVMSIGDYAFSSCTSLTSVNIPDSVTDIGGSAFSWCTSLTSITIPDSVTSIGYSAFSDCKSLEKVYYNGTADDWAKISIGSYNDDLVSATRYYYSETKPTTTGNWWHYVDGVPTVYDDDVCEHTYGSAWYYNADAHWRECTKCGEATEGIAHTYDSDDDEYCNACYQRTRHVKHVSLQMFSDSCLHWKVCDYCGEKYDISNHIPNEGYVADWYTHHCYCRECGEWANVGEHTFNDEGACTVCGAVRGSSTGEIKIIEANGRTDGLTFGKDGVMGEHNYSQFQVTKKYFAVSYTMLLSKYAGINGDHGWCGLTFNGGSTTCARYEYGCLDEDSSLTCHDLYFEGWWDPTVSGYRYTLDATDLVDTEVTVLVLGVVFQKYDTESQETVDMVRLRLYVNGEDVLEWDYGLGLLDPSDMPFMEGPFYGEVGWMTYLNNVKATVKYTESDELIPPTVFDETGCEHEYGDEWETNADGHYKVCTKCGEATEIEAHIYDGKLTYDESGHYRCCSICEKSVQRFSHDPEIRVTSVYHQYYCSECGYETEEVEHTFGDDGLCTDCGALDPDTPSGFCGVEDGKNMTWKLDQSGVLTITGSGEMGNVLPWLGYSDKIKRVVVGDGVTSIAAGAFRDCENLVSVSLPDTVEVIGDYAFSGCINLVETNIEYRSSTALLCMRAAGETCALKYIGKYAFGGCVKLVVIDIPAELETLGDEAFSGCVSLEAVVVPNCSEYCGTGIFVGCESLSEVEFADGASVSAEMFKDCTSLKSVELPETIVKVGEGAFEGCNSLETVIVNGNDTEFEGGSNTIPEGSKIICDADAKVLDYVSQNVRDTIISKHEHSGGNYASDDGKHWRVCAECGNPYDVSAHVFSDEWTSDASGHYHICTVCGANDELVEHTYNERGECVCGYHLPLTYGDVNGDGEINAKDIVLLKKYIANYDIDTESSTVEVSLGADANGDGTINAKDIVLLKKYIANYDTETSTSSIILGKN